ncbi:DUF3106 domain-containing protein [Rhodoferax sp.]|uniref:DUF3106 domain-containing protein n=1 Tax=Rhodoferax sp. TaxID=50421 RepID=UPI002ACEC2A8|nr:DUF3106 domain-containing protein [Rhodoferax sp.]MDZ7920642.1 DUF3106 domain-containing protein [Rhodoferax sp.]
MAKWVVICLMAVAVPLPALAQATPAAPPKPLSTPLMALGWKDLSAVQRQSLKPLEGTWDTLNDGHKRKWIALAQNYPQLAPAEQAKMHGRMAEWAALKPRAREMARLNFAETKKVTPAERAANWEAYQALSPEEKKRLAKKTPAKPAGAAVSTKPLPPSKLTPVPVTRLSPEADRAKFTAQQAIDPNTLLPLAPPK